MTEVSFAFAEVCFWHWVDALNISTLQQALTNKLVQLCLCLSRHKHSHFTRTCMLRSALRRLVLCFRAVVKE